MKIVPVSTGSSYVYIIISKFGKVGIYDDKHRQTMDNTLYLILIRLLKFYKVCFKSLIENGNNIKEHQLLIYLPFLSYNSNITTFLNSLIQTNHERGTELQPILAFLLPYDKLSCISSVWDRFRICAYDLASKYKKC